MDNTLLEKIGLKSGNHNRLSDLNLSISYSDAVQVVKTIRSEIYTKSLLNPDECLAFFCKNQVLDVLILIVLMAEKQRFIVVNGNNNDIKEAEYEQLSYCSSLLFTDTLKQNVEYSELVNHIKIQPNPHFRSVKKNEIKKGSVMFKSSGSTGASKIIVHNVDTLVKNCEVCSNHFALDPDDQVLIPVPICHMYGFGAALLPSLLRGVSISLVNNMSIPIYMDAERTFKPTVVFMTPGIIEMYLKFKRNKYLYKYIVSAGEKLNPDTAIKVNGSFGKLINLYGSSELGVIATSKNAEDDDLNMLSPLKNVKISTIPLNEDLTELLCNHPNAFEGYFNAENQSFESVDTTHSNFNTHDLVIVHSSQKFKLNGRKNLCVNRSGILVSLTKIEEQIVHYIQEVQDVVIVETGESDAFKGNIIYGYVVFNDKHQLSKSELKARCKTFLENYKIPDSFIEIDSIPSLPTGKPDRNKIKTTYLLNTK